MNPELVKLMNSINAKKQEVKTLVAEGKLDEAEAAKSELIKMQQEFNILFDLDQEGVENMKKLDDAGESKKVNNKGGNVLNAFVNGIKAAILKKPLAEEDREILNSMNEATDEDGALTVPQDLKTDIKALRRSDDALENLVNVETTGTLSGSRVIEVDAESTPFDNVDEEAEFPEVSTPQFAKIAYKILKKGGILKVSRELLQDTAENIISYLRKWIAKKSKATRNFLILARVDEITDGKEKRISNLDGLKNIFNMTLDPAIAAGSKVVTNQSGFNWLDTLKDDNGRYLLQPEPTNASKMLLFGKYPITKVSDKVLGNTDLTISDKVIASKFPIICGDFKEAITIFDRENMTIEMSTEAGTLWEKDQTGIKVRERLDVVTVDASAIVKAQYIDGTDTFTETNLNAYTIEQIQAIADFFGYTITETVKADIITEFLEQQA